jgi:hypothetical protein
MRPSASVTVSPFLRRWKSGPGVTPGYQCLGIQGAWFVMLFNAIAITLHRMVQRESGDTA